jgi:hypothetical protein
MYILYLTDEFYNIRLELLIIQEYVNELTTGGELKFNYKLFHILL